jgi:hypothetical protein
MLDLLKEYHITRVVTMGNRDQTKWSETYLMKYSHDETLLDDIQAMQVFTIINFKMQQKKCHFAMATVKKT